MHQARTEARAEAEAAAEQRIAAALALERAELVKQARGLSCTWALGRAVACFAEIISATDWSCMAAYVTADGSGGTREPQ